jgi:YegS/Rv2252/BmrU family lipid kinase
MKIRFIVNARSGAAAQALPAVQAFASERGAMLAMTQRRAHAGELAAQAIADGCELIVAVGGDGTMNEVASSLIGTEATLGLVPCGSGDGLGRHLGIHGSAAHALSVLETGTARAIDSGTADGHPFFTAAGLGFEAEIAERFNRLQRRGFLRYLSTSARLFREWQPEPCTIVHEGGTIQVSAFTLTVGNANQYGNNAWIAPTAQVDDGRLNLTVIPPVSLLSGPALLLRLFRGSIEGARGVTCLAASHFRIERAKAGLIHTDGETHEASRTVEFNVRAASLRIMAPTATSPAVA